MLCIFKLLNLTRYEFIFTFFQFRDDKTGPVLGSLINEIIKECNETRGASSVVPTVLHTAMTTRACKSELLHLFILFVRKALLIKYMNEKKI